MEVKPVQVGQYAKITGGILTGMRGLVVGAEHIKDSLVEVTIDLGDGHTHAQVPSHFITQEA